jgi:hypothetical protein
MNFFADIFSIRWTAWTNESTLAGNWLYSGASYKLRGKIDKTNFLRLFLS